eukprot:3582852-Amphidinium_carterae.1
MKEVAKPGYSRSISVFVLRGGKLRAALALSREQRLPTRQNTHSVTLHSEQDFSEQGDASRTNLQTFAALSIRTRDIDRYFPLCLNMTRGRPNLVEGLWVMVSVPELGIPASPPRKIMHNLGTDNWPWKTDGGCSRGW